MAPTEREPFWRQRIIDWQASGLSGMAYCKQQSLTYCRFVYWRKKLTEPDHHPDEKSAVTGFARVARVPVFAPVTGVKFKDGIEATQNDQIAA